MIYFVIQRLSAAVITLFLLVLLIALFRTLIPGDAVDLIMLESDDAESAARLREELGIDRPALVSATEYTVDVFRGDLGNSLWSGRSVSSAIADAFPVSAELALIAVVLSLSIAIPIGAVSAVLRDTPIDYFARTVAIAGITIPSFVIGTLVITLPAIFWSWSPPFRYARLTDDPIANLSQMLLPAIVMGVLLAASTMRLTRTMLLEILYQDYMRTARAKGLRTSRVIMRHGLPNALSPIIAHTALQLAFLLGGSAIIEQLFSLPGMGRLLLDSIATRDYPVVQGLVLTIGAIVVMVNLLADIAIAAFDPRIRYS